MASDGQEGQRVKMEANFFDERWCRNRAVMDAAWSLKVAIDTSAGACSPPLTSLPAHPEPRAGGRGIQQERHGSKRGEWRGVRVECASDGSS